MHIGIVGGGWTGLVLAYKLANAGVKITVLESADQIGGLSTFADYQSFYWDKFYHVILPSDDSLLALLDDLGLSKQVLWSQTKTGYYVDRETHPVSTTRDFLSFPPLNLVQKARLAWTILKGASISKWKHLEEQTVESWLIKHSGKKTFEKFWKPLLIAKLGNHYKRTSAVFIWTYIKRLFSARDTSSARKEQLGYVEGGYKTVLQAIQNQILGNGNEILLGSTVTSIRALKKKRGVSVMLSSGTEKKFDKVIFTGPTKILRRLADATLVDMEATHTEVEYLGVICVVLVLKKNVNPYYVLNIAAPQIPFTGIIGMSTLIDASQTGGHHLTYLPKYVLSNDPIFERSDEQIQDSFIRGLREMYPSFSTDEIISSHVHRARIVQPLQVLHYSEIVPKIHTKHEDFYVLNTSQFTHQTLNNDSVVAHVNEFLLRNKNHFLSRQSIEQ